MVEDQGDLDVALVNGEFGGHFAVSVLTTVQHNNTERITCRYGDDDSELGDKFFVID